MKIMNTKDYSSVLDHKTWAQHNTIKDLQELYEKSIQFNSKSTRFIDPEYHKIIKLFKNMHTVCNAIEFIQHDNNKQ